MFSARIFSETKLVICVKGNLVDVCSQSIIHNNSSYEQHVSKFQDKGMLVNENKGKNYHPTNSITENSLKVKKFY